MLNDFTCVFIREVLSPHIAEKTHEGRETENLKTLALKAGELAGVLKSVAPGSGDEGPELKGPELKPGPGSKPRSVRAT